MDDLYTENFFSNTAPAAKAEPSIAPSPETKSVAVSENPPIDISERTHQINYQVEQLQKALRSDFKNPEDFRFILEKIHAKIKQKKTEGIDALLTELEELMDHS